MELAWNPTDPNELVEALKAAFPTGGPNPPVDMEEKLVVLMAADGLEKLETPLEAGTAHGSLDAESGLEAIESIGFGAFDTRLCEGGVVLGEGPLVPDADVNTFLACVMASDDTTFEATIPS